jgi:hypothetical protein
MTGHRARIRMYRHGLGDCLLVRLARPDMRDFTILIDCGIILGTSGAVDKVRKVMANVVAETDGEIDLIVLTHAHGDHVSGFLQDEQTFRSLKVGEVWMAWTENPQDAFAQSLLPAKHRNKAVDALRAAANRMQAAGNDDTSQRIAGLMDFFGIDMGDGEAGFAIDGFGAAGGGRTTEDAVQVARELAPPGKLRYCEPGQPPFRPEGSKARIMVLGPPRDAKLIRKSDPTKSAPETYDAAGQRMLMDQLGPLAEPEGAGRPFSSLFTIPTDVARTMPFFQTTYWTGPADDADGWRGIDDMGASSALDLALKLDSDTNNTSLVIAIELDGDSPTGQPGRDVLLFAADAQVGNWLSWKTVKWETPEPGDAPVEGMDLVRRTLVYKVGHHGSHNATLKEYLESMERLLVALNPVDEVMAGKKRWDHIPLPSLEQALRRQASEALARADENGVSGPHISEDPLFYEVTV